MDNRLFMLLLGGAAAVILIALCKAAGFAMDVIAVIREQDGGGEVRTHGEAVPGVYTVLAVRDYYDGARQGIRILCERQDGGRSVFWISYDPFCGEPAPQPFYFFDTLASGDRISIQTDEDGAARAMAYYG